MRSRNYLPLLALLQALALLSCAASPENTELRSTNPCQASRPSHPSAFHTLQAETLWICANDQALATLSPVLQAADGDIDGDDAPELVVLLGPSQVHPPRLQVYRLERGALTPVWKGSSMPATPIAFSLPRNLQPSGRIFVLEQSRNHLWLVIYRYDSFGFVQELRQALEGDNSYHETVVTIGDYLCILSTGREPTLDCKADDRPR